MKTLMLPPARLARETYDAMLMQCERLKAAIRLHFEEHGIVALAFPATRMPPSSCGQQL
jgi:hypothetical protein